MKNQEHTNRPKAVFTIKSKGFQGEVFQVNYSDINFVSSDPRKIRLEYMGELPGSILEIAYNSACNCFTEEQLDTLTSIDAIDFDSLVVSLKCYISMRITPKVVEAGLILDVIAASGSRTERFVPCDVKTVQAAQIANRFFNRRYTGLLPDHCMLYEGYYIEFKRKSLAPRHFPRYGA